MSKYIDRDNKLYKITESTVYLDGNNIQWVISKNYGDAEIKFNKNNLDDRIKSVEEISDTIYMCEHTSTNNKLYKITGFNNHKHWVVAESYADAEIKYKDDDPKAEIKLIEEISNTIYI